MNGKYNAIDIAKYTISKCTIDGNPISNLPLQKILYFLQADYLRNNEILFNDDIEAWQFGPVVPDVYYEFCGYGASDIVDEYYINLDPEDKMRIDPIIKSLSVLSPWDLVSKSHVANGAWDTIYKNGRGNKNVIPKALIKNKEK